MIASHTQRRDHPTFLQTRFGLNSNHKDRARGGAGGGGGGVDFLYEHTYSSH